MMIKTLSNKLSRTVFLELRTTPVDIYEAEEFVVCGFPIIGATWCLPKRNGVYVNVTIYGRFEINIYPNYPLTNANFYNGKVYVTNIETGEVKSLRTKVIATNVVDEYL